MGSKFVSPIGKHTEVYYFIPFVFKTVDNSNIFEQFNLDNLPNSYKELVKSFREKIIQPKMLDMLKAPYTEDECFKP
jgi:hypothetical protein